MFTDGKTDRKTNFQKPFVLVQGTLKRVVPVKYRQLKFLPIALLSLSKESKNGKSFIPLRGLEE